MRLDLSKPVLSAQFSPTDDMLLAVLTPNSVTQLRLDPDSDTLRQMPAPPVRGAGRGAVERGSDTAGHWLDDTVPGVCCG